MADLLGFFRKTELKHGFDSTLKGKEVFVKVYVLPKHSFIVSVITFNFRRLNAVVETFLFVYRKQTLMWLQGDSYRAQKGKLEDKAVPRLITSMDELSLNTRSSISNHLQEVRISRQVSQLRLLKLVYG